MRQIAVVITLLLGLILVACQDNSPVTIAGSPVEPAVLETGAQVYADNCAACHGANLEGQPDWQQRNPDGTWRSPPHDETGHTWHHDDTYLLERIRSGPALLPDDMKATSPMPAYQDILSEAEIQAVLTYIKSTWPHDIQVAQADR